MSKKVFWIVISVLVVGGLVLAACTPETVVETVEVVVTVPGTGETIIVTATPAPPEAITFNAADSETLYDIIGAGETDTLDPAWNYENAGDQIIQNVYEQLITYNRTDATSFVPALAENWEVSEDGLTYTFYIREGVTFHDGAELTSEDVAYSFRRGLLQGGTWSPQWLYTEAFFGTGIYDIAELVDETGALDDDPEALAGADPALLTAACEAVMNAVQYDDAAGTVTFNLSQSWAPLLSTLAGSWGSILDKDWAIANGTWDGDCATWQNYYGVTSETTPLRNIMNGTGPYMFDHWTPGEETVLVANPNYWRDQQGVPFFEDGVTTGPTIDRVVIQLVNEWGTRYAMLQAGDADYNYIPRENVAQVDPLVGEWCAWDADANDFVCEIIDEDAPLSLHLGAPTTTRTDAFFVFDISNDGGNPYLGSGQLDGNGITPDFFNDIHVRRAFNYCFDWDAYIADALAGEAVQSIGYLIPGMIGYEPDGPHYFYDPEMCAAELQQAWDGQVWENGFRLQVAYNTGNVTRQTIAQILQTNFSDLDPKFQIEVIGLPWPSFLAAIRASTLPLYISGWNEDIHDPHNWAQPFLVGTYAARQVMPEEMRQEFLTLVSAGVAVTDPAERAEIYHQLTQLDYDYAPAIRLAVATNRWYQPRWMGGYYFNSIYGAQARYVMATKQ
ncbi:MAG: ABC transporter substrate-binding protein [Anaerolineae bacterium]|nr:ABC transporter substrate-binding protein [Anaerolineae bacterium]